jgi:hypothetical protein
MDNVHPDLQPLIYLLEDPDEAIYAEIKSKLVSVGQDHLATLEEIQLSEENPIRRKRLEEIINSIQQSQILRDIKSWKNSESPLLMDAVFAVDRIFNPQLERQILENKIDKIKLDVWIEMNYDLTSYEKIKILNYIFFDMHEFQAVDSKDLSEDNCLIHRVLENKEGGSMALSVLYSTVAQRLNIPVYGIDIPKHFLLGYVNNADWQIPKKYNDQPVIQNQEGADVVFYINPVNKGGIFPRQTVTQFLHQINVSPKPAHYRACSVQTMFKQYLKELIYHYQPKGSQQKRELLRSLYQTFD